MCDNCPNKGNSDACHKSKCLAYESTDWYIDELADNGDAAKLQHLAHWYRKKYTALRDQASAMQNFL